MAKYIYHLDEVPTYVPSLHSKTINRRLMGPGLGSDRLEVVHGTVEFGGQADRHAHPDIEQAIYYLEGNAEFEIEGKVEIVGPNDFIYLPPGVSHRVTPLKGKPLVGIVIYAPPLLTSRSVRK